MARSALDGPQEWLQDAFKRLTENRQLLWQRIAGTTALYAVRPEGATFLYVNVRPLEVGSRKFCEHLLARYGVPTVPSAAFAGGGEDHLRVPFGGSEDVIERVANALISAAEDVMSGEQLVGGDAGALISASEE
jgi:aspartate/methionine/tyrosine aminotransferase